MTDTKRRSYSSARRNASDEPVVFDIDGIEFKFHPARIPAAVVMDIPGMAVSLDSKPMWEVFECALGDDYPRFRATLRSPDHALEAEVLAQLLADMAEATSNLPTMPSTP